MVRVKLFVVLEENSLSSGRDFDGASVFDSSLVVFGLRNTIKLGVSSRWKFNRGLIILSGRFNDVAGVVGEVFSSIFSDVVGTLCSGDMLCGLVNRSLVSVVGVEVGSESGM